MVKYNWADRGRDIATLYTHTGREEGDTAGYSDTGAVCCYNVQNVCPMFSQTV